MVYFLAIDFEILVQALREEGIYIRAEVLPKQTYLKYSWGFKTRDQMWRFRVEKRYENRSFGGFSCPWPCNVVLLYQLLLRTDAEPNYCILWVSYKLPSIARVCNTVKSSCKDPLTFHFLWSAVENMINSWNTPFPGNICLKTQDCPLSVTIFYSIITLNLNVLFIRKWLNFQEGLLEHFLWRKLAFLLFLATTSL